MWKELSCLTFHLNRNSVKSFLNFFVAIYDIQEANQKLRGDTGIMRKKFSILQKEIDDHKEEIRRYQTEISKLNVVIRNLEKDIAGLKKEIHERDETIQDKVFWVLYTSSV